MLIKATIHRGYGVPDAILFLTADELVVEFPRLLNYCKLQKYPLTLLEVTNVGAD